MDAEKAAAKPIERFARCPHCKYSFEGIGEQTVCPECGKSPCPEILCEHCSYSVRGLEGQALCPECGKPPRAVPRCKRCFYVLQGLAVRGVCPECAKPYLLTDERTFTRKPPFVPLDYWWPILALAVGSSLAVFLVCVFAFGSWGSAVWIAPSLGGGAILGYKVRAGKGVFVLVCATTILLALGMTVPGLGGVFCFFALIGLLCGPIVLGVIGGIALRKGMKMGGHSQSAWLPVLVIIGLMFAVILAEGRPVPLAPETVRTSAVIRADRETAWRSTMYYEEVRHAPPLILRVGLARPLRTQGRSDRVGDIKTCLYNKGFLSKRTTEVRPGEMLAFEVVGQQIGYEHDVRLKSGAFEFERVSADETRVTLVTTYEPLLSPRWAWRPFERYAVHTLHGHVLEGMRREAEAEPAGSAMAGVLK